VVESKSNQIDVFSVDHKRTFCYIRDAINAIQLLSESKQSIGKAYNIGNENEEISMHNLAKKIIKLVGKEVKIIPQPATSGSPERRCPSIKKLMDETKYKYQISLDQGLNETYNWYKNNIFSGKDQSAK
jgi:nucleoside-diphosphate-sugar epimerase